MRHLHVICSQNQRSALVRAGIFRHAGSATHVQFFESLQDAEAKNFNFTQRKVIACIDTCATESSAIIDYYRSQAIADPVILFFDIEMNPRDAVEKMLAINEQYGHEVASDFDCVLDCVLDCGVGMSSTDVLADNVAAGIVQTRPHAPVCLARP